MSKRSSAYPSFSIKYCLGVVEKIYNTFGPSTYVSREDIAKAVGKNEGYMQMPISSSVQYGLLDRKSKVGYKPSELFLKVFKPLDDIELREARLTTIRNPKLYTDIFSTSSNERFPSISGLETIMVRNHEISLAASKKAAAILYENINNFGLIDSNGILNIDGTENQETESSESDLNSQDEKYELVATEEVNQSNNREHIEVAVENIDFRKIEIPLSERKKATLLVPENINAKDLDIISAQLGVIKLSLE